MRTIKFSTQYIVQKLSSELVKLLQNHTEEVESASSSLVCLKNDCVNQLVMEHVHTYSVQYEEEQQQNGHVLHPYPFNSLPKTRRKLNQWNRVIDYCVHSERLAHLATDNPSW